MSQVKKRKADDANKANDSDSGSDVDMISVDFVFNSPTDIDFDALKRLFIQLFYTHSPKLDAGAIADYIISTSKEHSLGTVIKVSDDEDNDPFAVISAAPISKESPKSISQIAQLLLEAVPATSSLHTLIKQASQSATPDLTFLLHERMINLPPAAAAPLYRLIDEELEESYSKGKAKPSHYLLFSRVFNSSALSDDDEDMADGDQADGGKRTKRRRKGAAGGSSAVGGLSDGGIGYFHPEDEIIAKFASHTETFRFPAPRDAAESFETPLFGRVVAVPREKWSAAVKEMEAAFAAAAGLAA